MSWPPPQPYRGRARPCRKPSQPCRRPDRPCRRLYRDTPTTKAMRVSQPPASYHGAPWLCRRVVSPAISQPYCASCHDTTYYIATHLANQTARQSRYKDCIVTQPLATSPSLLSRYKTLYRYTLHQPGRACAAVGRIAAFLSAVS